MRGNVCFKRADARRCNASPADRSLLITFHLSFATCLAAFVESAAVSREENSAGELVVPVLDRGAFRPLSMTTLSTCRQGHLAKIYVAVFCTARSRQWRW